MLIAEAGVVVIYVHGYDYCTFPLERQTTGFASTALSFFLNKCVHFLVTIKLNESISLNSLGRGQ